MTRRYLVTGAQGFIGRYLIPHLLDRFPQSTVLGVGRSRGQDSIFHHSVTCGDRHILAPLPEHLRNLDTERHSYVASDLASTALSELIRDFHPTAIIHLAASLRGISEEVIFQNNVRSTKGLLDAIRASGVKIRFLLLASSGGVYGRQESLPIVETAPVQPLDLYSRSKLASEELTRSFALQSEIPTAIARIFNVFGPGQDELHFVGSVAAQVAAILSRKSAPVIRTGPLSSTRDFLDVRDVCSALGTILERSMEGVCNVASGVETNVGDLLQLLLQIAGLQATVELQRETGWPDPIPRHFANVNRLAETGFAPQYSLSQTCQDILTYYTRLTGMERPE
jgi:nucleoside-diphosphate-sugar epimerase